MSEENQSEIVSRGRGLLAVSPIAVFLLLYVATSLAVGDFYKMPLSIAFIAASLWALITMRGGKVADRVNVFSRGAANSDILYMIWIFILAGSFSALAVGIGAVDATVDLALKVMPTWLVMPGLFLTACFISMSIGTSVGTIVALTPFASQIAADTGTNAAMMVAVVLGGSFFGDNLSFISDTTIASTRYLGVKMNAKFKANLYIAVPAAVIALIVYTVLGGEAAHPAASAEGMNYLTMTPYLLVIVAAAVGLNVLCVLLLGIAGCLLVALTTTPVALIDMCTMMGDGIKGMSDLIIVTLLAAGMLEVISHNGGIRYIIQVLTRHIRGARGARAVIATLVSLVNLCTANNTIAIITVGKVSADIARRFGLDPRLIAGVLDTCSCIVQCIIPYGAQTLLAAGLANLSPVAFLPYHVYPAALALMVVISTIMRYPRRYHCAQ